MESILLGFCAGGFVGGFIGYIVGYIVGWYAGADDAERRWSDAVGRADDARARTRDIVQ